MIGPDMDVNRVFKVRPFQATINPDSASPWVVKGEIRGNGYVLTVVDLEYPLHTTVVEWDERGSFAMVRDADSPDGTWLLRIQADYDDPFEGVLLPTGCWIHYHKLGDRELYEAIAMQAGYDPEKFEVIVPADDPGFSIHFDSDGRYESASFPGGVHSSRERHLSGSRRGSE